MSAGTSPQEAAAGESTATEKESQRKRRWETRVTTTTIAPAVAGCTVVEMLTLPRV